MHIYTLRTGEVSPGVPRRSRRGYSRKQAITRGRKVRSVSTSTAELRIVETSREAKNLMPLSAARTKISREANILNK